MLGKKKVERARARTKKKKRGSAFGGEVGAGSGRGARASERNLLRKRDTQKPQKLITDINTLTPRTLLLMYFLPFRPRATAAPLQHLWVVRACTDATAGNRREKNFRPGTQKKKKKPSFRRRPLIRRSTVRRIPATSSRREPERAGHSGSPVARPTTTPLPRIARTNIGIRVIRGNGGELTNFSRINTRPFSCTTRLL